MSILDRIVEKTKIRVASEKQSTPENSLLETIEETKNHREPFLFEKTLRQEGLSFICEIKKASPSKGIIAEDFPYRQIAKDYEAAGADAISVLTEPDFFLGSNAYLAEIRQTVSTPLLRKDFIIDPYQILQAKALGADAILLICAILTEESLRSFKSLADAYGLSCLFETHNEKEIATALQCGASIIGVNNRNLHSFEVHTENSLNLRQNVPKHILFASESGIRSQEDISTLYQNHIDAVLIGETLMKSSNKTETLRYLKEGAHGQN